MAAECSIDTSLRAIGQSIVEGPDFPGLREEDLLELIRTRARAHYELLWSTCDQAEKMILYHVATDGFVSWEGREVVRRLLTRGLLICDPRIRTMNETFRRFIVYAEPPQTIERWDREARSSTWMRVRAPIVVSLVALAVFFFFTQPTVTERTLAIVTALAAGIPALLKMFSSITGSK